MLQAFQAPGDVRTTSPLMTQRIDNLYGLPKAFLVENGFVAGAFDPEDWADPAPLSEAYQRYQPQL
jgi:hypothetical protein